MEQEAKSTSKPTPPATARRRWLTRETKLGLVVGGSFLALTGGMLGVKSLFKAPPVPLPASAPAVVVQASALETASPKAVVPSPSIPRLNEPPPLKISQDTSTLPLEIFQTGHTDPDGSPSIHDLKIPPDPQIPSAASPKVPMSNGSVIPPPAPDISGTINLPVPPEPNGFSKTKPKAEVPPKPASEIPVPKNTTLSPLDQPPPASESAAPKVKKATIRIQGDDPKKEPPAGSATPPIVVSPMTRVEPPLKAPDVSPLVLDPTPALKDEPKGTIPPKPDPLQIPDPAPSVAEPNKTDAPKLIEPPVAPPTVTVTTPIPAIEPTKLDPPGAPPAAPDPTPMSRPKLVPEPPVEAAPTKLEPPVLKGTPRIEPARDPKTAPPTVIDPAPPKNAPPTLDVSIGTPKADTAKQDNQYDEDIHSLAKNESYRSISKQYYNSEAYATALQRYNTDHPPGLAERVRIPPIWVLEKKYAGDISTNPTRAVNFAQPAADVMPRNEPSYTVSENGEMLADIAKKSLGDENQWKRIWDLNPQLNPAKTIPGGTRLRMPQ